jgi:cytoskeletal protein RodZ
MIIAIVVIAVLVLGGGSVAVWLLNKDSDSKGASGDTTSQTSEPTTEESTSDSGSDSGGEDAVSGVASDYADAVNGTDEAAATALTCDKGDAGTLYTSLAGKAQVEVGKVDMLTDELATVDITVVGSTTGAIAMPFEYKDGSWCVSI